MENMDQIESKCREAIESSKRKGLTVSRLGFYCDQLIRCFGEREERNKFINEIGIINSNMLELGFMGIKKQEYSGNAFYDLGDKLAIEYADK